MNDSISQINLPAILSVNALGFLLVSAILYSKYKGVRTSSRDEKLFIVMCHLCLALCVLEAAGFLLDGRLFPGARQAAVVCSTLILLLALTLAYLWVCYVDCKLMLHRRYTQADCLRASAPAAAIALLMLINLFYPIIFRISAANHYQRGTLFLLPWVVIYGYMGWGGFQSCRYQRRVDKHLFIPVLMFLIPVYLCSLIQLFFYGISLIWAAVALGLTCLYLNLQSEQTYMDTLTRLYNRNYLLHYMDLLSKETRQARHITGIMLDINGFKQINDTMGHTEGDAVLRAVGGILRTAAGSNTVIRYGGDEFIILLENDQPDEAQAIVNNIHRELHIYNSARRGKPPVSLAMGAAEFYPEDLFQSFHNMDMRMYEEKRAFYLRVELHETPCADTENDT